MLELRNVPFKQQEFILFYIVRRLPNFFEGRARRQGQRPADRRSRCCRVRLQPH
ncbi:hypothetical protein NWF32_25335 [Pseudomonas qingdaonensis]|nr:hypothetical protein [Pseudomonas qingdaonensis]